MLGGECTQDDRSRRNAALAAAEEHDGVDACPTHY